jgi:hypothetical protein
MKDTFSLQDVIAKIKSDLLSATHSPGYPVFFVDKVEIEMAVKINAEGETKLNIEVVELGGTISREQCNTIKITLSPILSREEQRELINQDRRLLNGIERASAGALRKGDDALVGTPE